MKKCELCKSPARIFCESDQASLCWDCDGKVHGANFLVAKHSRGLLCHTCESLTPWRASGLKLGRTISVCERCTSESHSRRREEEEEGRGGGGGEGDDDGEEDSGDSGSANNDNVDTEEDDLGDQDENDEADGDNQVVPWSFTTPPQPPPTSSLSSASTSSEDSVSRFACSDGEFFESANAVSLKRTRDSPADNRSSLREVVDRPFSQWKYNRSASTTQARGCDFSSRPVKYQRTEPGFPAVQAGSAGTSNLSRDFDDTKHGKLKEKH